MTVWDEITCRSTEPNAEQNFWEHPFTAHFFLTLRNTMIEYTVKRHLHVANQKTWYISYTFVNAVRIYNDVVSISALCHLPKRRALQRPLFKITSSTCQKEWRRRFLASIYDLTGLKNNNTPCVEKIRTAWANPVKEILPLRTGSTNILPKISALFNFKLILYTLVIYGSIVSW